MCQMYNHKTWQNKINRRKKMIFQSSSCFIECGTIVWQLKKSWEVYGYFFFQEYDMNLVRKHTVAAFCWFLRLNFVAWYSFLFRTVKCFPYINDCHLISRPSRNWSLNSHCRDSTQALVPKVARWGCTTQILQAKTSFSRSYLGHSSMRNAAPLPCWKISVFHVIAVLSKLCNDKLVT